MSIVGRTVLVLCFSISFLFSAPHVNERFELRQPDGTRMPVIVNGDEYYQRVEDLHGRTLIRDEEGWICYAQLNHDSTEFIPGERYTDTTLVPPPGADLHLELHADEVQRRSLENRRKLHVDTRGRPADAPPSQEVVGDQVGLTLLADFSDESATVSREYLYDLINGEEYGTHGSVWQYFYDISNGKLNYKNIVTEYIRPSRPKSYYDDPNVGYGQRARELIHELLDSLYYDGFDFSKLSREGNQIIAVNLFYAGSPDHGWSNGLWPHMSGRLGWTSPDGAYTTGAYQITNIGQRPNIGTFAHENGHMLLGHPDLYPYSGERNWVGRLCLMGSGMGTNPAPMNPWFRYQNGWIDSDGIVNITDVTSGTFSMEANDMSEVVYYRSSHDANQFYFIQNVSRSGRWASHATGSGMKVWRINRNRGASNTRSEDNNPLAAVVGYSNNIYMSGRSDIAFSAETTPAAHWHENVSSSLEIRNLSDAGALMTFDIGDGAELFDLTITAEHGQVIQNPEGDRFSEGDTVVLEAEPEYGYQFSHWDGDISGSENPYTLIMDEDYSVEAHFTAMETYTLNIVSEQGFVAVEPYRDAYVAGDEVTLTVFPEPGYKFSQWDGDISGAAQNIELTIDEDMEVVAEYTPHGYETRSGDALNLVSFSSEDTHGDGRPAQNLLDEDSTTIWFSDWQEAVHPHEIVLSLHEPHDIAGMVYQPRADHENGRIREYEIYVSSDGQEWGEPEVSGEWRNIGEKQEALFEELRTGTYVRLVALSEVNDEPWASGAGLGVLYNPASTGIIQGQSSRAPLMLQGSVLYIGLDEAVTVELVTPQGRRAYEGVRRGDTHLDLRQQGVAPGVYLLRVQTSDGTRAFTRQVRLR
ncbi:M6 family metalloprotease domain-containing protein [Chitinivibrio alkaliphilus ACht1]|uniref:M6 family metalloprotease domain-containing protein n=2 Tax=Chitinivibrio TaxID=1505231 RepID=U7D9W4_9BACT|nr:M6 family metalloprotease domain-containing protein [Chitinivibrio alkaliphilus ACht1]